MDSGLGFKWTFWIPGIAGGIALLLLIKPFHNEPGAIGLRPVGASEDEPVRRLQHGATARIRTSVFLRQAQRTGSFWNLVGLHFWGCVGHNTLIIFLVAIAMDEGMSRGSAAGLYITLTAVSTVFRFVVPVLADRMGDKRAMALVFSMQTLPIVILFISQDVWAFYLFAILFGIGTGGENATFPIISRQYYGNAPIGTAYGWQVMGGRIGMALGPLLGGFLWDVTGGYMAAMILSFVASFAGLLSVVALPTTAHLLMPHWEDSLPPEARSSAAS